MNPPPMDRSGLWLIITLAAVAFAAVAFIVVRTGAAGPIAPSPTPVLTTWPSGIGEVGGRPAPSPTRRAVAPTTWRPDRHPAPTTNGPAQPSHTAAETPTPPTAPTTRATIAATATAAPETTAPTSAAPPPTTAEEPTP